VEENKSQKWSVELAYTGSMGEQDANSPFLLTEKEMPDATSVVPRIRSFDKWSDYAEALQSADTLHITHVHDSPKDADAFFPKIDPQVFRVDSVAPQETDPQSGICYNFTIYKRR
jgi:hypothetical protein